MGRRAETVLPLRHVSENPTTCVPHRYGVPCARRMIPLESKDRATPLRSDTVKVLKTWINEQGNGENAQLFPSNRSGPLSRDAVERIVAKHCRSASKICPTLREKKVTPHSLRHGAAMALLHQGIGCTVIALWLGHESVETTQIYLHADLRIKEKAMEQTRPIWVKPGRFKPDDALLGFLRSL